MTDEFLLFFKICNKIGASSLGLQLRQKHEWVNTLLTKYSTNLVGYHQDDVIPFSCLPIKSGFSVEAGKTVTKAVEVFHENSVFYFKISIEDHDINLKLFFMGDF